MNNYKQWFAAFVDDSQHKLRHALQYYLSAQESEDALQELYVNLYKKFVTHTPQNPMAYAYRAARNLAIDILRQRKTNFCELDEQVSVDSPTPMSQAEQDLVRDAIEALPPISRNVLIAAKYQGKSHKDIAIAFGISPKTVENHLRQAMIKCNQFVKERVSNSKKKAPEKQHASR